MKAKTFDCVEMKRRGSKAVYEEVKGMTAEQEIEYWRAVTDGLKARHSDGQSEREQKARRSA